MDPSPVQETISQGWPMALVGALTGAFGRELIQAVVKRGEAKDTLSHTLREELRADLTRLQHELEEREGVAATRLTALEGQVEEWRGKYYQLLTDYHELRVESKAMSLELKALKASSEQGGPA